MKTGVLGLFAAHPPAAHARLAESQAQGLVRAPVEDWPGPKAACLARRGRSARLRPEIIPSSGRQAGTVPVPGFPSAPLDANASSADPADAPHHSVPARMSWARLLKRVFDVDIEQCSQCGGTLKIIAAIEDPTVIAKILTHLGLPARAPPRSPARSYHLLATA
ncbi:MAG: hypothetical protein ACREXY_02845 [Gammaproteobacteria bacterium]